MIDDIFELMGEVGGSVGEGKRGCRNLIIWSVVLVILGFLAYKLS
jgi:hypothetical protein